MESPGEPVLRQIFDICFPGGGYPNFRAFPASRRLYFTQLDPYGLLLTIIDGVSRPAPVNYQTILDVVRQATGNPATYWVTILAHDNMAMEPVSFTQANLPWRRSVMEWFEAEEGAQQGGDSFLMLISEAMDWVLWHCFSPGNDFTITFHGPADLCEQINRLLDQTHQAGSADPSAGA